MNVLFISRAKQENQISPVVQAQADSISKLISLSIFLIRGRGWKSYVNSIFKLRKYLKSNDVDLIHAHYSHTAYVASLASKKPVVCSLMGSDVEDYRINRFLIRIFAKYFWKAVIIKSQGLKEKINIRHAIVIPNGVNLDLFKQIPADEARKKMMLDIKKKYALFLADPVRPEKNFSLAQAACDLLKHEYDLKLIALNGIKHDDIPYYLSASDVLVLTSLFEGSPNAIKEAMACNCPIVSTNVGDVEEVIGNTEGCYICSFEPEDVAEKLLAALQFGKRTNGRENIKHLDDKVIAQKLIDIYEFVMPA
jgi:glycosyltransferase involved in cell wall biosynthesis